jgi:hypothetical protein
MSTAEAATTAQAPPKFVQPDFDRIVKARALTSGIAHDGVEMYRRSDALEILDEDLRQWVHSLSPLEVNAAVSVRDRDRGGSCREEPLPARRTNRAIGSVPSE